MQLSTSICSVLLPFLEEPLVICWELLLSSKSNFIPPDKMCTVFVCARVLAFAFFVHIQYVWACEYRHTWKSGKNAWVYVFMCMFSALFCFHPNKLWMFMGYRSNRYIVQYHNTKKINMSLRIMERQCIKTAKCPELHTISMGTLEYLSWQVEQ